MLILLDRHDNEVASLDERFEDDVIVHRGRTFEYEDIDRNDFIFREVES